MFPAEAAVASELFDEDGFVLDFLSWSSDLAYALAQDAGIGPLAEAHWRIIHAIRGHFSMNHQEAPVMHRICRDAGIDRHQVNELFGDCLAAWRVAGLPNPGEEAKAYLNDM